MNGGEIEISVSVKHKVFENEGCQKNLKTSTSGCDMLEFVNSRDSHTKYK
jgi:hypothetical protein